MCLAQDGWVWLSVLCFWASTMAKPKGLYLAGQNQKRGQEPQKSNRRNSGHGCRRIATERRAQIVESGTIGGILFLGSHQVLFWCPLLAQVALSSGEAELNSSVHGVKESIGFVYMLRERIGER